MTKPIYRKLDGATFKQIIAGWLQEMPTVGDSFPVIVRAGGQVYDHVGFSVEVDPYLFVIEGQREEGPPAPQDEALSIAIQELVASGACPPKKDGDQPDECEHGEECKEHWLNYCRRRS